MKRLFPVLLCLVLLSGCTIKEIDDNGFLIFPSLETTQQTGQAERETKRNICACWLSYLEWNPQGLLEEDAYRSYTKKLLSPLHRIGATDLFLQVRAFADAIYPSAYFESSEWIVAKRGDQLPFDYLNVVLEEASAIDLHVHAWINPYRVLSDASKTDVIGESSVVGQCLKKQGNACFLRTDSGLYFQPASAVAQDLILQGAEELLSTYPIAGIHLDDYFYPPDAQTGDDALYDAYRTAGGSLDKHAWRCAQVDALLHRLYALVHANGRTCVLSVSPSGDPDKDDELHCANVALWCEKEGYCDWIIPQLYYGFKNESLPFSNTAKAWKRLCKSGTVQLIGGLAVYKCGKADIWAGENGKNEWIENPSLIARQAKVLSKIGYAGCSLYSAQFVNFQEKVCAKAFHFFNRVI